MEKVDPIFYTDPQTAATKRQKPWGCMNWGYLYQVSATKLPCRKTRTMENGDVNKTEDQFEMTLQPEKYGYNQCPMDMKSSFKDPGGIDTCN